jgi:hypothetical protein
MNRGRRAFPIALCAAAVVFAFVSCSDSKDDSEASTESLFKEVRTDADRVAELSAAVAVATLSTQGDSVDATTREISSKHPADVKALEESVCSALQRSAKKASHDEQDSLRATANEALRDSFVLQFLRGAIAASPERQAEIVQLLAITSRGSDGAPLQGAAALKDASLSSPDGSVQIPARGTIEYTKYTDWLSFNDAFAGFTDTITADYTKAANRCPLA